MSLNIRQISTFLNQWAPPSVKMDYDNVGLLVGNPDAPVQRILTCLDVTEAIVQEAIQKRCDLIIAHHPLIFSKIGKINPTHSQGRIIYSLIKNDIGLLVAHTNLDAALDGVSFALANTLGLDQLRFLKASEPISRKIRLVTSHDNPKAVLQLLNYYSAEDAHYFHVDNRSEGLTCFEATIDQHLLKELKKGLRKEGLLKEGKFQVTQLASSSKNYGYGVVGEYPEEGVGMNEFLHLVSKALKVKAIRYSGTVERIKKVAVCGGSGSMLTQEAIASGAQAFVTSDIKYHDYFLEKEGFMLLDVGHYESEFPVVEALKNEVSEAFESLDVLMTQRITNPMNVYLSDQELKTTQPPE